MIQSQNSLSKSLAEGFNVHNNTRLRRASFPLKPAQDIVWCPFPLRHTRNQHGLSAITTDLVSKVNAYKVYNNTIYSLVHYYLLLNLNNSSYAKVRKHDPILCFFFHSTYLFTIQAAILKYMMIPCPYLSRITRKPAFFICGNKEHSAAQ